MTETGYVIEGIGLPLLENSIQLYKALRSAFPQVNFSRVTRTRNKLYLFPQVSTYGDSLRNLEEWHGTREFLSVTRVTTVPHRQGNRQRSTVQQYEFPVVAKGVSPELSDQELLQFLRDNQQPVTKVIRLRSAITKRSTHRIKIIFSTKDASFQALQHGILLGYTRHSCEEYTRLEVPFCGKCLKWGHQSRQCNNTNRCYRCGSSNHITKDCKIESRKCGNCDGDHATSYKGCKVYQDYRKDVLQQRSTRSTTPALSNQTTPPREKDEDIAKPMITTRSMETQTFPDVKDANNQTKPRTANGSVEARIRKATAHTQTDPIPKTAQKVPATTTTPEITAMFTTKQQLLITAAALTHHGWEQDIAELLLADLIFTARVYLNIEISTAERLDTLYILKQQAREIHKTYTVVATTEWKKKVEDLKLLTKTS